MSAESTSLRSQFVFPTNKAVSATALGSDSEDAPCAYLCGNSLGLLSKRAEALVLDELKVWGTRAVEGHFDHPHGREWAKVTDPVNPLMADIVGAKPSEVACMGTLTANLHLMMNSFYKPTPSRYKILCEAHAFPSDQYAFASQALHYDLNPEDAILELNPRLGEFTLREEDILDALSQHGHQIALVMFSGIQYYTGQLFPIEKITRKGHEMGCIVGWDLAHAAGNVPLSLHAWDADFAVWCTYKYLNSGPGGIGALFVHERHAALKTHYAGWWGHDPATRFQMPRAFAQIPGAQGFQQSNPSVLAVAALLGSLELFQQAGGMGPLRARSERLTGLLAEGLARSKYFVPPASAGSATASSFTVITPTDPSARGAQLSLLFLPTGSGLMQRVDAGLKARGVIGDERRPDVIRLAPAPLYNDEGDVRRAVQALEQALDDIAAQQA